MKLDGLLDRVRTRKTEVGRTLGLLGRLDESSWDDLDADVVTHLIEAQHALSEAEWKLAYTVEMKPRIEAVKSHA